MEKIDLDNHKDIISLILAIKDLPCWYVSCGGAVGSTFKLILGKKIPRGKPVPNELHPPEFRENKGEISLLVWCAWRLHGLAGPLAGSGDDPDDVEKMLSKLIDTTIKSVDVDDSLWDLRITFSNGFRLTVFCDTINGDSVHDQNWDFRSQEVAMFFGPGKFYRIEIQDAEEK